MSEGRGETTGIKSYKSEAERSLDAGLPVGLLRACPIPRTSSWRTSGSSW